MNSQDQKHYKPDSQENKIIHSVTSISFIRLAAAAARNNIPISNPLFI